RDQALNPGLASPGRPHFIANFSYKAKLLTQSESALMMRPNYEPRGAPLVCHAIILPCTCSVSIRDSSADLVNLSRILNVEIKIRTSTHGEALRTYHSSYFSFSSGVTSLA